METSRSDASPSSTPRDRSREIHALLRRVLRLGDEAGSRVEFLRGISEILLDYSGCERVELRSTDGPTAYQWEARRRPGTCFDFRMLPVEEGTAARLDFEVDSAAGPSTASFPFPVGRSDRALLVMHAGAAGFDGTRGDQEDTIEFYRGLTQIIGHVMAGRRARAALNERVKELTCLYGIARIVADATISFDEALDGIVSLLPEAWRHPAIACARLTFDGIDHTTAGFREGPHRQWAGILMGGERRGIVEVFYIEDRLELGSRPFLEEERKLLEVVAQEVALLAARRHADEEKGRLESQLRHADRLATIGQLTAGVAHELNEPLGGILGFAQLALKAPDLPAPVGADLAKIVKSALHAREVIRKLMFFSRQIPPRVVRVDLNKVVEDGLALIEARCARSGIELARHPAAGPVGVLADPAQLQQVLVNLAVNAIQAMPDGGRLTVRTRREGDLAVLSVEDSGAGMTEEVRRHIFTPFYTTKDVGQGTGLGLAVSHGIVKAHGGAIEVESEPGRGSRFEVRLQATPGTTPDGAPIAPGEDPGA